MDDLTIEKLQGPHNSVARNPLLAHIFYLAGRIEQYGPGMERIRNALAAQGQPPQTIETLGYGFVLIMREPAAGKGKESSGEKQGISSVKIVELMAENPAISIPEIAEQIGKTTRAVEKQITKLKLEGSIKRIGPAKGGRWEVVG